MELRLLICLAIAGTFPILGNAAKRENSIMSGSGDDESSILRTDDEDDFYIDAGSGSLSEKIEDRIEEAIEEELGSGMLDSLQNVQLGPNMMCENMVCWCKYDNGTKVPGTEKYAMKPENCAQYKSTTLEPTTTALPTRVKEESPLPDVILEVTEGEPDLVIEFETKPTSKRRPFDVFRRSTTAKPSTMKKVTVGKLEKTSAKEATEEDGLYMNVKTEKLSGSGLYYSHPGILAAIIGGAVVGLLCAILLVMFVVYRMRKKDEGSYPLNDSKPLKDYAYSKAPSREFYA